MCNYKKQSYSQWFKKVTGLEPNSRSSLRKQISDKHSIFKISLRQMVENARIHNKVYCKQLDGDGSTEPVPRKRSARIWILFCVDSYIILGEFGYYSAWIWILFCVDLDIILIILRGFVYYSAWIRILFCVDSYIILRGFVF